MSLFTCCPACSTTFKVVPDQLKISDGWVRCGYCAQVFEATAHLQAEPVSHKALESGPSPMQRHPAYTETTPQSASLHIPDIALSEFPSGLEHAPDSAEDGLKLDVNGPSMPPSTPEPWLEPMEALPPTDTPDVTDTPEASDAPEAAPTPSFLRSSATGGQRVRTLLLSLMAMGLSLGFIAQVVFHERDRLASWMPAWQAPMQQLCVPLGCRISPLRQIDSLTIDSSEFRTVHHPLYRLAAVIHNRADWPLAVPALELTVLDLAGQATLRRVIQASEIAHAPEAIAAGGEWALTAGIDVKLDPSRVAGYRLLAFYP